LTLCGLESPTSKCSRHTPACTQVGADGGLSKVIEWGAHDLEVWCAAFSRHQVRSERQGEKERAALAVVTRG